MKIWLSTFLLIFFFSLNSYVHAQKNSSSTPTIGFGVGTVGFYGDLHDKDYGSPISGNPAFSIFLKQKLNDYLAVRFTYMSANIRGEERSLQRNVNFETTLRSGAVYLDYNFDQFLPKHRKVTPIVSIGLEVVKFNPKTDIKNRDGERYNYWLDGTIRNLSENSTNANNAVLIQRDYNYETDIREVGYNPSVTYENSAFVIPVGIGVTLKLNDQFNFRLESMMHLTFTDYIDGITPNSSSEFVGQKKGNANNDHYLINSASLSYNFQKIQAASSERERESESIELLARGNTEDYDNDGVIDLLDQCPNTPPGIEVDAVGCPIDSDGDGIPDYLDEDPFSKNPKLTNEVGVELTDEMIYESYLRFNDSTLKYAEVLNRRFGDRRGVAAKYRIKLAEAEAGETPKNISKLLSIPDLNKIEQENKVIYTVGNYGSASQAYKRAEEMNNSGFENIAILEKDKQGSYINSNRKIASNEKTTDPAIKEDIVVFRVQLGAYENRPSENTFKDVKDLIIIKSDGLHRYMSGSFNNFRSAAKYKLEMLLKGYKDAFVVPYKDGKRVSLKSVGVNVLNSDPLIGE